MSCNNSVCITVSTFCMNIFYLCYNPFHIKVPRNCLWLIPYYSQPAKWARLIRSIIRSIRLTLRLIWQLLTKILHPKFLIPTNVHTNIFVTKMGGGGWVELPLYVRWHLLQAPCYIKITFDNWTLMVQKVYFCWALKDHVLVCCTTKLYLHLL